MVLTMQKMRCVHIAVLLMMYEVSFHIDALIATQDAQVLSVL